MLAVHAASLTTSLLLQWLSKGRRAIEAAQILNNINKHKQCVVFGSFGFLVHKCRAYHTIESFGWWCFGMALQCMARWSPCLELIKWHSHCQLARHCTNPNVIQTMWPWHDHAIYIMLTSLWNMTCFCCDRQTSHVVKSCFALTVVHTYFVHWMSWVETSGGCAQEARIAEVCLGAQVHQSGWAVVRFESDEDAIDACQRFVAFVTRCFLCLKKIKKMYFSLGLSNNSCMHAL